MSFLNSPWKQNLMPQMSPLPWMMMSAIPYMVTYAMAMKSNHPSSKSFKKTFNYSYTSLYKTKKHTYKWKW